MTADKSLTKSKAKKCTQCSKEFRYDSERRRHEKSHFPEFQCRVCNKNFSFVSALRRHEKQHERTDTAKCDKCMKVFRDDILLKRHIKYKHGGTFKCTECGSIFNSVPALRTHMETHKPDAEKRYKCAFEGCTKKFNFPHHLKHHELTHSNTKQHFCKICGKGFIQSHHLKTHMKRHDNDYSSQKSRRKFGTEIVKDRHPTTNNINNNGDILLRSETPPKKSTLLVSEKDSTIYDDENTFYTSNTLGIECPPAVVTEQDNIHHELAEDLSTLKIDSKKLKESIDNDINYEFSNCKSAVGGCIMKAENEKCVCDQITNSITKDYDFVPIETDIINLNTLNKLNNNCEVTKCCGGKCGKGPDEAQNDVPEMAYSTDGTVKIKEFLDIDNTKLETYPKTDDIINASEMRFIPLNSCKSILGKCIVSGNGTISDACLCAKMTMDDDEVNAQEIEDITPHPNNDELSFVV